jgi:hypothetical protein
LFKLMIDNGKFLTESSVHVSFCQGPTYPVQLRAQ